MLCIFLKMFGNVYHIHSRKPPERLTYIDMSREWFNSKEIDQNDIKNYKVIFLFRNPADAQLSAFLRMGMKWAKLHFRNIQVKKIDEIESLQDYVEKGIDLLNYNEFFDNYMNKELNKNYSIIGINYDKLWDNLPEVFKILEISEKYLCLFPVRKERKKKVPKSIIEKLTKMNKELIDKIDEREAITIIPNHLGKTEIQGE